MSFSNSSYHEEGAVNLQAIKQIQNGDGVSNKPCVWLVGTQMIFQVQGEYDGAVQIVSDVGVHRVATFVWLYCLPQPSREPVILVLAKIKMMLPQKRTPLIVRRQDSARI